MNRRIVSFAPTHRQALASLSGTPGGQLGFDPMTLQAIGTGVAALIPNITGQAAANTFTSSAGSFAAQQAEEDRARRNTMLGVTAVTVVGLGVLTYFALRK